MAKRESLAEFAAKTEEAARMNVSVAEVVDPAPPAPTEEVTPPPAPVSAAPVDPAPTGPRSGAIVEAIKLPQLVKAKSDYKGRIPIYIFEEKKWIWRYPIDVREYLARGIGTTVASTETGPAPEPVK